MPGFGDELGGYLPKVINRLSEWVFFFLFMMLYKMQGNFIAHLTQWLISMFIHNISTKAKKREIEQKF